MATDQQVTGTPHEREFAAGEALPGRYVVFAIVSLALLMASVDQTIVATALPSLQHDLHAQVNWSSWTITIYALGQILVMPLAGKLGDQYGRKKIFLGAAVLFTTASLCCGFAGNIYLLIVLRALQATGGGAFMPTATGIVSQQFGPERDRAVGLFSSVFPLGGIIGPVLGGIFVTYWSWRGIFLVNVPLGIILVTSGRTVHPGQHLAPGPAPRRPRYRVARRHAAGRHVRGGHPRRRPFRGQIPCFLTLESLAVAAAIAFARHTARSPSPFISAGSWSARGSAS